jgi:HK97 family phage major capsid protein
VQVLTYLRQLTTERDSLTAAATSLAETAATEGRDLTETEAASLATMQTRCAAIDAQLTTYGQQADSARAYADLRAHLTQTTDDGTPTPPPRGAGTLELRGAEDRRGWGEMFTDSDAFRAYNGRGSSAEVELPGLFTRAPIQLDGFPGTLPPYYHTPVGWSQTTPLLDAVGKITTNANVVEWYTWPGMAPPAAEVPEGTAKPEMDYAPTPHTESLVTYAHYKAISRQALEDIPQIQSVLEGTLRRGVIQAIDNAVATALNDAANGIPTSAATDLLAGIRVAIGNVQSRGYVTPNAAVMNPADFAAIDIAVMLESVDGPVRTGSVWGVPIVAATAVPVGTVFVGDMKSCVSLFARNQVAAYMSDSHADFFIKNLLVLLAEQRALAAITEPLAAEKVTVSAGGPLAAGGAPAERK